MDDDTAADYMYAGDHETLEHDVDLMVATVLSFEFWVAEFRQQTSISVVFEEKMSIGLAKGEVKLPW